MVTTKDRPAPDGGAREIRDRIVELVRVPASELVDNDRNWRVHPYAQRQAIAESLEGIGIADALIAYHSERAGGKLTLIDGHARREETEDDKVEWPVLILDVTDAEADQLLLTLDPMTGMASADAAILAGLLEDVQPGTPALEDLLRQLDAQAVADAEALAEVEGDEARGPAEMELQAFEHYDYIMLLFKNALDWGQAKERFGLTEQGFTLRDGVTRKVGLGRVIDGRRVLAMFQELDSGPVDQVAAVEGKPKKAKG